MLTPTSPHTALDQTASPPIPPFGERGFTLIEIIAVLLLMGILLAVAISRPGGSTTQAEVAGAVETVKGHLRYAQATAMNSDLAWGINFAASTYTLQNANNVTASLPGDLPTGMTFAASINPVLFDNRWGGPGDTTITVTISKGSISQAITITKNTGFIP